MNGSDRLDFLGEAASALADRLRVRHASYLRLLDRSVALASGVLLGADIGHLEREKVVASALLGRLLMAAQSGAILAVHGLEHDAAVGVRTCFEILVNLRGCAQVEGFCERYLASDLVRQRKLCRAVQGLSDVTDEEKERSRKREAELCKEIADRDARSLSVEAIAREVGMADAYNTVYRLTSGAVHTAPRILEDFITAENGKPTMITFGPSDRLAAVHLFSYVDFLRLGTEYFSALVEVDCAASCEELRSDLEGLGPDWPDEGTAPNKHIWTPSVK